MFPADPPSPPVRLLIVEDDLDLRSALEELLSGQGFDVTTAENGLDALILMERGGLPDLVLLDLQMPVMNGFEFLDHLRRRETLAHVPVLVVSALAHRVSSEVAGVVSKPVDAHGLLEAIGRVVDSTLSRTRPRSPDLRG